MDTGSMERNVMCVKWGTKFSAEHVNRLYRMARRNISLPFTFYCYTEDATDIHQDIKIVPLDLSLDLEAWWWKMTLFKENDLAGINLFFDLDVVIQNNIDNLFNKAIPNKLTLIDRSVFDTIQEYMYNSSIMVWYNNQMCSLYNTFTKRATYYTKIYSGIDRLFTNEFSTNLFADIGTDVYYFRTEVTDLFTYTDNQQYSILFPDGLMSQRAFYNKEKQICVFNSCHENYFYKNMEDYFL